MKDKVVYISGPMTGYHDFNRSLFHFVERYIHENFEVKEVINPANIPPDYTWEMAMKKDLADVREKAEVMIVLPGWENSKGARLEVLEALKKDIEIVALNSLIEKAKIE